MTWFWGFVKAYLKIQTFRKFHYIQNVNCLYCPTLIKGSKCDKSPKPEKVTFYRLDLACSTSTLSLEQKHSSCWKILKSRHNDIALMSMYMTNTFCSFTWNVTFKSCFLLSELGSIHVQGISNASGYLVRI